MAAVVTVELNLTEFSVSAVVQQHHSVETLSVVYHPYSGMITVMMIQNAKMQMLQARRQFMHIVLRISITFCC